MMFITKWTYESIIFSIGVITLIIFLFGKSEDFIDEEKIISILKKEWSGAYSLKKSEDKDNINKDLILTMPPPAEGSTKNDQNLINLINKARKIHYAEPNKKISIVFQRGIYNLSQPIELNYNKYDSNTSLVGDVNDKTTLNFIVDAKFLISVNGSNNYELGIVSSYDSIANAIIVDNGLGLDKSLKNKKLVDIVFSNGKWDSNPQKANKKDYFGQVNRISSYNGSKIVLNSSFLIPWNFKDTSNVIKVYTFNPLENIEIMNFIVKGSKSKNSYVKINGALNVEIKNMKFIDPYYSHLSIDRSNNIYVEQSIFDSSVKKGPGGQGYGVAIGGRSSNCIIQNNFFTNLRHAIVISTAANYNVIGYNYIEKQRAEDGKGGRIFGLGDIVFHGYFPYGNLIEGNYCDRIIADEYWGSNGPYNFVFNNIINIKKDVSKMKNTLDRDNIVLTENSNYDNLSNQSYYADKPKIDLKNINYKDRNEVQRIFYTQNSK